MAERLRTEASRRTLGLALALLIEAMLLFLLLSLGSREQPGKEERGITVVNVTPDAPAEETPEPSRPEPEQRAKERTAPQQQSPAEPLPPQPAEPLPPQAVPPQAPTTPVIIPTPFVLAPSAATPATPARPAPSSRPVFGPADSGGSSSSRDTAVVGTAPNGEPLYAAAWYRKPGQAELRGYMSTANGPGWGLIACRTVPDYRVEDCVALDEYPAGSQINRAVLAAAWQFKVRPPQLGGRSLVGSWVRIRIDYGIERR